MTSFTVVICTRNRPAQFAEALASVLMQRGAAFDVCVVMDGSDPMHDAAYEAVIALAGGHVRVLRLDAIPGGHGHAYAANRGAWVAGGDWIAFLDDDDVWVDPDHLARAAVSFAAEPGAELYLADQDAYRDGRRLDTGREAIWIESLGRRPGWLGAPDAAGTYAVDADTLMRLPGFCHMNTMIVCSTLFLRIGGLDAGIRYEEDRDFYLRAVDAAAAIRYRPAVVARHNVPDPVAGSFSAATAPVDRALYRLRVYDKTILLARRDAARRHALAGKGFVQRHLARDLAAGGRPGLALRTAVAALATSFSWKWAGYCLVLAVRAMVRRRPPRPPAGSPGSA